MSAGNIDTILQDCAKALLVKGIEVDIDFSGINLDNHLVKKLAKKVEQLCRKEFPTEMLTVSRADPMLFEQPNEQGILHLKLTGTIRTVLFTITAGRNGLQAPVKRVDTLTLSQRIHVVLDGLSAEKLQDVRTLLWRHNRICIDSDAKREIQSILGCFGTSLTADEAALVYALLGFGPDLVRADLKRLT